MPTKQLKALLPALIDIVDEPDAFRGHFQALCDLVEAGDLPLEESLEAMIAMKSVGSPLDVLRSLVGMARSEAGLSALRQPRALETFTTLAGQGAYPCRVLTRHPEDLLYVVQASQQDIVIDAAAMIEALQSKIESALTDEESASREEVVLAALRHFKRRQSLRLFLREVRGLDSVRQTTAGIADLAEACLSIAVTEAAIAVGRPDLAADFCVLGMGKLGGRELNYSSDVDIVFVCSDRVSQGEERVQIDALARWVRGALDDTTGDGYVFRVDLRLRPEGTLGALVQPVSSMIQYYLSWGRTWERSAWLKARPVGGNLELGEQVLTGIDAFLYRKYLDYSIIDELRLMKQMVNQNARMSAIVGGGAASTPDLLPASGSASAAESPLKERLRLRMQSMGMSPARGKSGSARVEQAIFKATKNVRHSGIPQPDEDSSERDSEAEMFQPSSPALGWDVKIGVGGIREIEFFVQALQLVHCGTRPGLRVRNTLDALDRILYTGLLSHEDHAVLADAYDLFRRLEHRVQMEHDRQDHRLPRDEAGLEALGRRMRMPVVRLRREIEEGRTRVSEMFGRLFRDSEKVSEQPTVKETRPPEVFTVLAAAPDQLFDPAILKALKSLGFSRSRQVAGQLQVLREKPYGPFGAGARLRQAELASYLLEACASAPNSDQAFSYLSRLFTEIGDQPGFYAMLYENPHAARLLVHVFGSSPMLAGILLREPDVFERLLTAGTAAIVRTREEIGLDLRQRLRGVQDQGRRLGRIRRFHQEETLRIALHEIAGASRIEEAARQLSLVAEVVIEAVLDEVYASLRSRLEPQVGALPDRADLAMAVLAMGKLGGREMGFGSDLDIIFVYEAQEDAGLTHELYTRLAQRLIRTLSSASEYGKLYDVDTRLRPSGSQGTLVVSVEAFEAYHNQRADLWERQALIKARPVTGAASLRERLMELRKQFVFQKPLDERARSQMLDIRDQMRAQGPTGSQFDVKASPGGQIDVEYLTQYLQLRYANAQAELADADFLPRRRAIESVGDEVVQGITSQSTLVALEWLAKVERVRADFPELDFDVLQRDYRSLRRIEARVRMGDSRSENQLPGDPEELHVLARRLGYQGKDASRQLEAELTKIAARVRKAFADVFDTHRDVLA